MKLHLVACAALALLAALPEPSAAGGGEVVGGPPAGALLYLDRPGWQAADAAERSAMASDFMRMFCGNPAMPASDLVACLNQAQNNGSLFAHALSCVASAPSGAGL